MPDIILLSPENHGNGKIEWMTEKPLEENLFPCPYCGRMTSKKANFCYYCARELVARPEHPGEAPKPFKLNWIVLGLVVVVVLSILLYLLLR